MHFRLFESINAKHKHNITEGQSTNYMFFIELSYRSGRVIVTRFPAHRLKLINKEQSAVCILIPTHQQLSVLSEVLRVFPDLECTQFSKCEYFQVALTF